MAQQQQWSHSLFDCSPFDTCLLGTFLPCVLLGRTADRVRNPGAQTHDGLNGDCGLYCAIQTFTGCGCIYAMMKRGEIRQQYNIEGSGFGDFCASYCCHCCALIQQDNEVAARQSNGQAGAISQGYQSQKGMEVPQQQQPQQHYQQQPQQQPQQQYQQQQQQPQQHYQQQQQPQYPNQAYQQHPASSPPPQYGYQQPQQPQQGYESHGVQQVPATTQQGYPQEK